jgi:hypothetical protein
MIWSKFGFSISIGKWSRRRRFLIPDIAGGLYDPAAFMANVLPNVPGTAPTAVANQLLDAALGKPAILASERKAMRSPGKSWRGPWVAIRCHGADRMHSRLGAEHDHCNATVRNIAQVRIWSRIRNMMVVAVVLHPLWCCMMASIRHRGLARSAAWGLGRAFCARTR